MSNRILSWLGFRPRLVTQNIGQEDSRYPAFSKGIPVEPIENIVGRQRELIQQIVQSRGLSGLHNRSKADELIISPINHFAEWVHLLPASDNSYFKGSGGLFRFGLEHALFSIRYAERSVLTRVTPEERREAERVWTHAAFLAGLVSESVLTLSKISVYSDNGETWHPGVEPLYQWLVRNNVKNYHIRWLATVDFAMAAAIAAKTIQQEQAALLAKGEKSVLPTLMSAIQNPHDGSNQIVAIVRTIRLKLIDKDLAEDPSNYGKPLSGMHLEPWLIDAMRHMVVNRHWQTNTETGRIWYGLDGVYLVWPLSGMDIRQELRNAKCPFMPKTTEILAEMMCEAGIIDQNEAGAGGGYIFTIGLPQASSELKTMSAIRLKRKEILLLDDSITPIDLPLLLSGDVGDGREVTNIGQFQSEAREEDSGFLVLEPAKKWATTSPTKEVESIDTIGVREVSDNTVYDADYAAQYADVSVEVPDPATTNLSTGKSVQSLDTFSMELGNHLGVSLTEKDKQWVSNLFVNIDANPNGVSTNTGLSANTQMDSHRIPKDASVLSSDGLLKSRCPMVIKQLNKLPSEFVELTPEGNTKINAQGLSKINMDIKDCLAVLGASGQLVLTDGEALVIERKGSKDIRCFLVKVDIRHGL